MSSSHYAALHITFRLPFSGLPAALSQIRLMAMRRSCDRFWADWSLGVLGYRTYANTINRCLLPHRRLEFEQLGTVLAASSRLVLMLALRGGVQPDGVERRMAHQRQGVGDIPGAGSGAVVRELNI